MQKIQRRKKADGGYEYYFEPTPPPTMDDHVRFFRRDVFYAKMFLVLSLAVAASGFCFIIYQGLLWLRDGYWTELPLRSFVPINKEVDWSGAKGLEKIGNWILDIPPSLCLIALGAAFVFASLKAIDDANARLSRARDR